MKSVCGIRVLEYEKRRWYAFADVCNGLNVSQPLASYTLSNQEIKRIDIYIRGRKRTIEAVSEMGLKCLISSVGTKEALAALKVLKGGEATVQTLLAAMPYRRERRDAHKIESAARRGSKRGANGMFVVKDVIQLLKAQRGRCYYCGAGIRDNYTIDHVIPVSRGGANTIDNVVLCCKSCNSRKGDKLPHEWAEGGRLL